MTKHSVISLKGKIPSFSKRDLKSIAKKLNQKLKDKEEMLALFRSVISLKNAAESIDIDATNLLEK